MNAQSMPSLILLQRRAALCMAGATVLMLVFLAHHPVVGGATSMQETLVQLAAAQQGSGLVHGALSVALVTMAGACAVFSAMLGLRRPAVLLALAAYSLGCCAMLVAMLLDGFATPQLAAKFAAAAPADVRTAYIVIHFCATLIQVFAKAGFLCMCLAMLAWSWALVTGVAHIGRRWARSCAALGLLAGALPALFVLFSGVQLSPPSLMAIIGAHGAWYLAAAALLYGAGRSASIVNGIAGADGRAFTG